MRQAEFYEEMEAFHKTRYLLGHCLRWGARAVEEILEFKNE